MQNIKSYVLTKYDRDTIKNIVDHGFVNGAAPDLIYYFDTCKFYDAYQSDIWGIVNNSADDFGISPIQFIAQLNGGKNVCSTETFKNLLTWFAVEHTCHSILEGE